MRAVSRLVSTPVELFSQSPASPRVATRHARVRAPHRRMYKSQKITVISPCLNEEQGIEQVLRSMPEFVDEVIVVDNGSTDKTSEVARSYGARVIREDVRGYGRSYKSGFASAKGDIIITL